MRKLRSERLWSQNFSVAELGNEPKSTNSNSIPLFPRQNIPLIQLDFFSTIIVNEYFKFFFFFLETQVWLFLIGAKILSTDFSTSQEGRSQRQKYFRIWKTATSLKLGLVTNACYSQSKCFDHCPVFQKSKLGVKLGRTGKQQGLRVTRT